MDNKAKIAELRKNINNKFFPEALKPKLLAQIEKLEAEDNKKKFHETSVVKYKDGTFRVRIFHDGMDMPSTQNEILDNKEDAVKLAKKFADNVPYGKYILFVDKESKKPTTKKSVSYGSMSDEDFAFTTLGKICAADGKAWDETKVESGSEIRQSDELQKIYAKSLDKQLKELGIAKNSLGQAELDYLENYNYWLLIEFLAHNDYFDKPNTKDYYEMMWLQQLKENPSRKNTVNPKNFTIFGVKAKKPTVARSVKSATKKYYSNRDIKTITILEDGKKATYKASDVLNGAQFLAKGGTIDEISDYVPIRNIVEIELLDGTKTKPANGYHIKKGAKPIAANGIELPVDNYNIERLADGGEIFDYKQKYDKTKIKSVADVKQFFEYLHNTEKLVFHPDDEFLGNMEDHITKKQAMNLDRYMLDCFDVCEKENTDIYGIAANVHFYAEGGWTKDHIYLNKKEDYEVRYAKGKNRKEYKADGGLIIGRKAKGVSLDKIAEMHGVTKKYLQKQIEKGQKVELEHTTDEAIAYAIAKDHLYENPDYYILLNQIEMKASGGEVKEEWVIVKPNGYYSLNASSGGGRFLPSLEMAYTYSEEEAKKLAQHLQEKSPDVTIKAVKHGTPLEDDPYDKYKKGGLVNWNSSANNGKKVRGIYEVNSPNFKGYIQIVGFEQVDDKYYGLYQPLSDERIGPKEIHSINVDSNKINSLDKGLTVVGLDQNKQKVKIKRVANLGTSGYFEKGGQTQSKPKRQGSKIFDKAKEIREPGEKWQEAVRRANLLLKK